MKETEKALRNSINDAQTAAGIIQSNRELLENKLNDKRKLVASTSESHKVITKKYTETEKADLSKEEDEPSYHATTSASGRSLSSKDTRGKSAEARQTSGITESPSAAKPSSPVKTPVSDKSLSSRDPRRESTEIRQASEITDSSSVRKPESHKVITKKYTPLKTEKADLSKELRMTAAGIIQNNRELLENELNDKQKLVASTSESHKVITKKKIYSHQN